MSEGAEIRITWFARLRDAAGCDHELITLPEGVETVADLIAHLRASRPDMADALGSGNSIRAAVNEAMTSNDQPLKDGDELALFPPFTGG